MGAKSVFDKLPKKLIERFHELIRNGQLTNAQIAEHLTKYAAEFGEETVITPRIVQYTAQTYKARLVAIGEERRREKEIISEIMATSGMKPDADQAQLTSILLQSIISKVTIEMSEGQEMPDLDDIKKLAWTHKIVNESNRVIEQLVKQAKTQAAEEAAAAMKANGVDDETIRVIERVIVRAGENV
jgi:hypothetical protein